MCTVLITSGINVPNSGAGRKEVEMDGCYFWEIKSEEMNLQVGEMSVGLLVKKGNWKRLYGVHNTYLCVCQCVCVLEESVKVWQIASDSRSCCFLLHHFPWRSQFPRVHFCGIPGACQSRWDTTIFVGPFLQLLFSSWFLSVKQPLHIYTHG